MNVLLIGSGGREHALAWKMAASPLVERLVCAPGNAGIAQECEVAALDPADHDAVIAFCRAQAIDFVVVGPETPLCAGVVACTSAIRALLAFSFDGDPAYNFLLKRGCCHFAQAIGVTSDPRITFPYLLKICASKLGLWAAPAGSSTATASLDDPRSSSASAS